MKINKVKFYLDGGSIELNTDKGNYVIDCRIKTTTKGMLYKDYPLDDNSNLINNPNELFKEILEILPNSDIEEFLKKDIKYLIEKKEKNIYD